MLSREKKRKYLLIDDDPTYHVIMEKVALTEGMDLESCKSLMDLGSVGFLRFFDAAIVDYDLEQMNGIEIGEYISALFADLPVLLVSNHVRRPPDNKAWPDCIKGFLLKSDGFSQVLSEARKISGEVCNDFSRISV